MKIIKTIIATLIISVFLVACQNNTAENAAADYVAASAKTAAKVTTSWQGGGTEPFWSVEISAKDGTATVQTPEKTEAPILITAATETEDATTYSGENLKIRIKKGECSDGMSETVYLYSCEMDFDIYELKGCVNKK